MPSFGDWAEAHHPCKPDTLLAVEPMIAVTTGRLKADEPGKPWEWPIYTADGSLAVHYEHDVLITENGPRVLTEGLEGVEDVILR